MFTGIVEEVGTVAELATDPQGAAGGRLRVKAARVLAKLERGASVAVNGCCLTVTEKTRDGFACDLSPETLARTAFRRLAAGARVNLEAALTLGMPLGGHIVQGHVDATGSFIALKKLADGNYGLEVDAPAEASRYIVEKGSIAVEGVSLTVAAVDGARFTAAIIPFTYENTNLRTLQPGDPVNLECDVLAKYVEKLLADSGMMRAHKPPSSKLTLERLRDEGF
jgi:riboflavin synthase